MFDQNKQKCSDCGTDLYHCLDCKREGNNEICSKCDPNVAVAEKNSQGLDRCTGCRTDRNWQR